MKENDQAFVGPAHAASSAANRGLVVWFTGLSAAGKTTLANYVQQILTGRGYPAILIDGDALRAHVCNDLGFSIEDRNENVRRAGLVARTVAEAGMISLVALISPFRVGRDQIRAAMPAGRFVEVFVNATLAACEERDPKGLYKRARNAELSDFTGISSPYEPPLHPEVEVRSDLLPVAQCGERVMIEITPKLDAQRRCASASEAEAAAAQLFQEIIQAIDERRNAHRLTAQ